MNRLLAWLWSFLPDNCEVCHGKRGGMRGNENRIDGVVMCDYCSIDHIRVPFRCPFCGATTISAHDCGQIL